MNKVEKVQIFNSLKDEELSIHDDENDSWCTHYILKKNKKDCLKLSREALECFYDIHIKQAAACLGISLSYMKLLRVWGDLPRWPWRDVKSGISSKFTMSDIESKRIAMINDTKTSDILLHDCLVKAQEIRGKVNAKAIASELLMKKKMYDRALARTSRKNKYKSKKKKTKVIVSVNVDNVYVLTFYFV